MHIDEKIRAIIVAIAPHFVPGSLFELDGKFFSIGEWCQHRLLHVEVFQTSDLSHIVTIRYHKDGQLPQAFHG